MAKHQELPGVMYAASLGRTSASTIWRTVVFAGAMLATPLAGCGGGTKKADTTATEQKADPAADKAAADKAAADKAAADKAAADKAAADQAAADKAAADKAAEDQAAADKAAEEQAKKRPRGGGGRPTGRGFVLA